jgi:hypothetical protein
MTFYVRKSVHRKSMLIIVQRDATIYSLFIAANCCTCFGWWHHPSSGAHITVFTASGTGCSVWAATSGHRGWIETAVSIHPRQREVDAQTLWPVPDAVYTVIGAPGDGWYHRPKHVQQCAAINILYRVASRWTIIDTDCHYNDYHSYSVLFLWC